MPQKTPSTESSKEEKLEEIEQQQRHLRREKELLNQGQEDAVVRGRRMEDQMRLRELELQTNFQIKTLTESLNLLKTDFHSWRDSFNTEIGNMKNQVENLKFRLTLVIALIVGQMAGAPQIIGKLFAGL